MGWAGIFGEVSAASIALYVAAITWTIGYDTIYALQDSRDDAIVGVRSTARLFGRHVRQWVAAFYGATLVAAGLALSLSGAGPWAWLGWAGFAVHLGWQVRRIDIDNGIVALRLFRSNWGAGLILFAGLVAQSIAGAR